MFRTTLLTACLAAAFVTPALAADQMNSPRCEKMGATNGKQNSLFNHLQARDHLIRQGYANISQLTVDGNGNWRATATKSGRTMVVAIKFKPQATTN